LVLCAGQSCLAPSTTTEYDEEVLGFRNDPPDETENTPAYAAAPVAYDDSYYVIENRQKYIGLRVFDGETVAGELPLLKDMSRLIFEITEGPSHGALRPTLPHTQLSDSLPSVLYIPEEGFVGEDYFTFTVTDVLGGESNTATVRLLVGEWRHPVGIPDPPFGLQESVEMYSTGVFNYQPRQVLKVAASADDSTWSPDLNWWSFSSAYSILIGDVGQECQTFLRFPIQVPSGSVIKRARIRFVVKNDISDSENQPALIQVLDSINMPELSVEQHRTPVLGTPVPWLIDLSRNPRTNEEMFTADITELIQRYIDQEGRQTGDYIGIKITRDNQSDPPAVWKRINMYAWDSGEADRVPILDITYEPAGHQQGLPYRNAGDGPYTHYVDFNAQDARDVVNGFFNYGTPDVPRRTIPGFLPSGSVVEVHGVADASGEHLYITGRVDGDSVGGTADKPVFIRGARWDKKPEIRRPVVVRSNYTILENIYSTESNGNWEKGSINLSNTGAVDHNASYRNGDTTFHHVVVRHCVLSPPKEESINAFVLLRTYKNDAVTRNHHVVVYDNHMFDNGNWTQPTGGVDRIGVCIFGSAEDVWILENHIHHIEGDAVAMASENLTAGSAQTPATRVYIGRNHLHHCRENHIDGKLSQHCVISQNKMHTVMDLSYEGSSGPTSIVMHHGGGESDRYESPDNIWVLGNEFYDVGAAFTHVSNGAVMPENPHEEARSYVVGNFAHDIWKGERNNGWPFIAGDYVVERIVNNTMYRCHKGILILGDSSCGYIRNNIMADMATDYFDVQCVGENTIGALDHNLYQMLPDIHENVRIRINDRDFNSLEELQQVGYGSMSIVGDAGFTASGTGDIRLAESSLAINAGIQDEVYDIFFQEYGRNISTGYYNGMRPAEGLWDIGAYEYRAPAYDQGG
jgi:hypothetical protein